MSGLVADSVPCLGSSTENRTGLSPKGRAICIWGQPFEQSLPPQHMEPSRKREPLKRLTDMLMSLSTHSKKRLECQGKLKEPTLWGHSPLKALQITSKQVVPQQEHMWVRFSRLVFQNSTVSGWEGVPPAKRNQAPKTGRSTNSSKKNKQKRTSCSSSWCAF